MTKLNIDLYDAREKLFTKFGKDLEDSNKLWYGTIRLIITLSSSFLLLTLAIAKKLFPEVGIFTDFSSFLITAWIALFFSIIFGIITEIDACIFHGNSGRDTGEALQEIDIKINQGLKEDIVDMPESYFKNAPIVWGVATINSFIFAIICLCLSFLDMLMFKYSPETLKGCIVLLLCLNIHLIRKRKHETHITK